MDERSENERWYDEEIAPVLLEIGELIKSRGGASFIATVEFDLDRRGSTICLDKNAGLAMLFMRMLDNAGVNLDAFMINVIRHCRANDIDTSSSIALTRWSKS